MGCSDSDHMYAVDTWWNTPSVFRSGISLAAQANAGEIKTLVILISDETPDENSGQNAIQSTYRLTFFFFSADLPF